MIRELYILGIDPGVVTGLGLLKITGNSAEAVCHSSKGTRTKPCNGLDAWEVLLSTHALVGSACVLAVEGQFLPTYAGAGQAKRAHALGALRARGPEPRP